jgi:ubiquinone/menaquinone biosynthesis C-methylase UbiE
MEAYGSLAQVYDLFMDNVDYAGWGAWLTGLLKKYGVENGLVLDLGCGTGNMTEQLALAGYDMIGVDCSAEMLEMAQEKKFSSGLDILYLQQDMREFELYGTVGAVVSVCDSLNYILEKDELLQVFRLVNNYLDPGGIFLFDLNTASKYREIGDRVIAENREEGSFIWENDFDEGSQINAYQMTIFLREGDGGLYRKYEEVHYQRAYGLEEIRELVEKAGLEYVDACEAFTERRPDGRSERICVIAREKGKRKEQE